MPDFKSPVEAKINMIPDLVHQFLVEQVVPSEPQLKTVANCYKEKNL